ncbi:hypothetical protein ACHAXA_005616 [Cyclostephanos tholiformis]|uniref:tRNA:m(4)X modification enzyme TRM13 n=1 Tax=Cyclostephanos tholiformis TaxID=382380 RepID=A0ABD3SGQ0_9STRA
MSNTNNASGPTLQSNEAVDNVMPSLPDDWDRCHAYNEFKRRYCRQMPVPLDGIRINNNQPRYCGNHMHLLGECLVISGPEQAHELDLSAERNNNANKPRAVDRKNRHRGNRIPCPIDPSHLIFEGMTSKHVLICPAVKRKQELIDEKYFYEGINLGGYGDMGDSSSVSGSHSTTPESEEVKKLAYAILRVFHHVFLSESGASEQRTLADRQLKLISENDIYSALSETDLSRAEEDTCCVAPIQSPEEVHAGDNKTIEKKELGRLTSTITKHRVNAGGPRHLRQIASILGHARREGLISTTEAGKAKTMSNPLIVEMGAGRGMTGLVIAGAMAASFDDDTSTRVSLCLVERSGTRRKAETRVRTAEGYSTEDCLRLDRVDITRVKCDLADVDMSKALEFQLGSVDFSKTVMIAKHLCGVGTDLAIRSIRNLVSIDGCVMATCCHGLCLWNDYVGRDCLLSLFRGKSGGLTAFGEDQFNVMKRWASAAVSEERLPASGVGSTINDNNKTKENYCVGQVEDKGLHSNVFALSEEFGLSCGGKGLGRACQRLIDYGRCEYMKGRGFRVKLVHYVPSDVTPQNALIVATKEI